MSSPEEQREDQPSKPSSERRSKGRREPIAESVYKQLHGMAEKALQNERAGHSMQPTLLVNDTYLKLLSQQNVDMSDRSQVLAAGANIIRRLLVDYARARKAGKRGGKQGRGGELPSSVADTENPFDILDLHEALSTLANENARAAQVVELKFFGGLSGEEIATQLTVSLRTVNNDWKFAKAWLYRELAGDPNSASVEGAESPIGSPIGNSSDDGQTSSGDPLNHESQSNSVEQDPLEAGVLPVIRAIESEKRKAKKRDQTK